MSTNYMKYAPQSWSLSYEEIIRRFTYVAVAKEFLASRPELHKCFDPEAIGSDMQFADLCRGVGLRDSALNVIGCARAIGEMVLVYECPVLDEDLEGNFRMLMDGVTRKNYAEIFGAFVTGITFPVFVRAWHSVRPHIDDIYDYWVQFLRRDLVRQHGAPGWQAEMFPLFH